MQIMFIFPELTDYVYDSSHVVPVASTTESVTALNL